MCFAEPAARARSIRSLALAACCSLLLAALSAPALAAPLDEARSRVQQGEVLFTRGDFRAALTEYEQAYALIDGHPIQHRALFNIAKCHEKLFDYPRALAYYERYLREGGPDAERRAEVEALLPSLRARLATLVITAAVRAEIWVDGAQVGMTPAEVPVSGGRHTVMVRAAGYEPHVFESRLAAGQTHEMHIELERLSDLEGASPVWFWTGVALASSAIVTSTVLGAVALERSNDLKRDLADDTERWRADPEEAERVDQLALAADVALGAAVMLSATTLVLYFVTDWSGDASAQDEASLVRAVPVVGPTGFGVLVGGAL
jgi:tetratricopeptide (TPR) repeat protein